MTAPQPARTSQPDDDVGVELDSGALHDLLGPVNQIRSMADLILKRCHAQVDSETETLFGFIQDSSNRLENLLSGLRTYMRVVSQGSPFRYFDANVALAGALSTIQDTIDRNDAQVTFDRLPEVFGDPSQISYAFASLVENAIKFRSDLRPEIHVAAEEQENGYVFSVSDNGMGIDPRNQKRIFGVFKRVHNDQYPGAGMGLAIAKRVVERHGGGIWVESRPGHGATFFVSLPSTSGVGPAVSHDGPAAVHHVRP
jgi:light-regulated signal transduction histidine kinase (bacteriophytochrome)